MLYTLEPKKGYKYPEDACTQQQARGEVWCGGAWATGEGVLDTPAAEHKPRQHSPMNNEEQTQLTVYRKHALTWPDGSAARRWP